MNKVIEARKIRSGMSLFLPAWGELVAGKVISAEYLEKANLMRVEYILEEDPKRAMLCFMKPASIYEFVFETE